VACQAIDAKSYLVLHQREERAHHHCHSLCYDGRQLVAQRLATSGRLQARSEAGKQTDARQGILSRQLLQLLLHGVVDMSGGLPTWMLRHCSRLCKAA
jgi:hypothetical protein